MHSKPLERSHRWPAEAERAPVHKPTGWATMHAIGNYCGSGGANMKPDQRRKSQTGREHEVGSLSAPLLNFDLNREIQQLRSEGRWQSGHTAKTLVKYSDFRMVLVAIKAGGRMMQHRTEGRISIHNLTGH